MSTQRPVATRCLVLVGRKARQDHRKWLRSARVQCQRYSFLVSRKVASSSSSGEVGEGTEAASWAGKSVLQ